MSHESNVVAAAMSDSLSLENGQSTVVVRCPSNDTDSDFSDIGDVVSTHSSPQQQPAPTEALKVSSWDYASETKAVAVTVTSTPSDAHSPSLSSAKGAAAALLLPEHGSLTSLKPRTPRTTVVSSPLAAPPPSTSPASPHVTTISDQMRASRASSTSPSPKRSSRSVEEQVTASGTADAKQEMSAERLLLLDAVLQLRKLNERPAHLWDLGTVLATARRGFQRAQVWQVLRLFSLTKGVDKCAKLYQYCAKLVKVVCWNSIWLNAMSWSTCQLLSDRARKMEKSMSSNRKTLRLLKALKEVQDLRKVWRNSSRYSVLDSFLYGMAHSCSFAYYSLDHFLWLVNVQVIRITRQQSRWWWKVRNLASIWRLFFRLLVIINAPTKLREREDKLWGEFEAIMRAGVAGNAGGKGAESNRSLQAQQTERVHSISKELRLLRAQKYAITLDMAQWYCNFILLGKALEWFSPPMSVVSIAGCVNAALGMYQLWLYAFSGDTDTKAGKDDTPPLEHGLTGADFVDRYNYLEQTCVADHITATTSFLAYKNTMPVAADGSSRLAVHTHTQKRSTDSDTDDDSAVPRAALTQPQTVALSSRKDIPNQLHARASSRRSRVKRSSQQRLRVRRHSLVALMDIIEAREEELQVHL